MAQQWFYQFEGQEVGPLTVAQLKAFVRSGKLTTESMIRSDAMAQAVPLRRVKGLVELLPAAGSHPTAAAPVAAAKPSPLKTARPTPAASAAIAPRRAPAAPIAPAPSQAAVNEDVEGVSAAQSRSGSGVKVVAVLALLIAIGAIALSALHLIQHQAAVPGVGHFILDQATPRLVATALFGLRAVMGLVLLMLALGALKSSSGGIARFRSGALVLMIVGLIDLGVLAAYITPATYSSGMMELALSSYVPLGAMLIINLIAFFATKRR